MAHTWRGTCVCLSTGSYVSPIIYNTQKGKASNTWFLCLNGVRFLCQIITPLLKWVVLVSVLLTSNTNRFLSNHFLLEVLMSFTVVKNIISVFFLVFCLPPIFAGESGLCGRQRKLPFLFQQSYEVRDLFLFFPDLYSPLV